ncbi:hypothetical protein L9F63_023691 [Diploptera punctata]|uniref:C-type lectin domain-containing protein n=1 Tax=Diploptera punctata TaxID=6984 RepID=A0AAD7ZJ88_DIPPU|nr:hypothetical protein L9F63_023691 [Diploptera punctata]
MDQHYLSLCVLPWFIFFSATGEIDRPLVNQQNDRTDCGMQSDDNIKITIYSRKNKTGQLYVQVSLEESTDKKNSWQVNIDHDSTCGLSEGGLNMQPPKSVRSSVGKREPLGPFYEFVPGMGYYKLHTERKNWFEAKEICKTEGAHLAIVNSNQEAALLIEFISRLPPNGGIASFIGISDISIEGSWVTVLGDPLNKTGFQDWYPGDPSCGTNCNCGGLSADSGKLRDLSCNGERRFYCEI